MSIEKPVKIELKTYVCDYRQGWKTVDYIRGCNDTIDQSDKYWEQEMYIRSIELQIQHLNFEKNRLKKRYAQSITEINSHIKNCERDLAIEHKLTKE